MYCKYCGKPVETDSNFCRHCGRKLTDEAAKDVPHCMSSSAEAVATFTLDGETYTVRDGIVFDEDGFDVGHMNSAK